ncbi:transcription termination factor 1, mitochondrial isoform 4-T5 [Megaptera novaeangliae]
MSTLPASIHQCIRSSCQLNKSNAPQMVISEPAAAPGNLLKMQILQPRPYLLSQTSRASSAAPEPDLDDGILDLECEMDAIQMRYLGVQGADAWDLGIFSAIGVFPKNPLHKCMQLMPAGRPRKGCLPQLFRASAHAPSAGRAKRLGINGFKCTECDGNLI